MKDLVVMRLSNGSSLAITEELGGLYNIEFSGDQEVNGVFCELLSLDKVELTALYEALRGLKATHPEVFKA